MTVTLSEILNFPCFYQEIKKEKLPISIAYQLAKIKKEIDFHISFYQDNLREIISECAQKDEEGNMKTSSDGENILLKPEMTAICAEKIKELSDFKVKLSDWNIKIEDFGDINLRVDILEIILPLLEQKEDC